MPEYRRTYRPGGTFFFTIVTHLRRPLFADPANLQRLRSALREVRAAWPFHLEAAVVLPDHMHLIWTLPPGDNDFSKRIGRMKVLFTRSLDGSDWEEATHPPSSARSRHRHDESGVWQRRFWEHLIRDERDYEHHLNYLHFNPVKHELCACPDEWSGSSFAHWVRRNVYPPDWCCRCRGAEVSLPYPTELDGSVGE